MPINILMPALSPTMTEGNVANWLKKEGDPISPGDLLCEIETDKATMEVEAIDEGTLGQITVPAGTEGVAVNAVIGIILEEGEEKSAIKNENSSLEESTGQNNKNSQAVDEETPTKNHTTNIDVQPESIPKRIMASPLARRMAEHANIDLATLSGSGPAGRIVKSDIENAIAAQNKKTEKSQTKATATDGQISNQNNIGSEEYTDTKISSIRKVIASRLQDSKRNVPHFYLNIECKVDSLLKVREQLNSRSETNKLSLNDFVIRACAIALRKIPECNSSWLENGMVRNYHSVDISIAVAIKDGLVTPIIKNADNLGLGEISKLSRSLANKAREEPMGLAPEEYQGGSFSISNLGMYGVKDFQAVINSPQAMIMAVGAADKRPIVKDDAIAVATTMNCTLSVDHRVVDGAKAAEFLSVFKSLIEDPLSMLL